MGFFKNIFKRRKGGTKLGNFIRGIAHKVSDGKFGNGDDLKRALRRKGIAHTDIKKIHEFQLGSKVGEPYKKKVDALGDNPAVADFEKRQIINTLKKWWWAVAAAFGVVILITIKIVKK